MSLEDQSVELKDIVSIMEKQQQDPTRPKNVFTGHEIKKALCMRSLGGTCGKDRLYKYIHQKMDEGSLEYAGKVPILSRTRTIVYVPGYRFMVGDDE